MRKLRLQARRSPFLIVGFQLQLNVLLGGKGGNGMFVNQLLLPIRINDDRKIVKCFQVAPKLKSVRKKNRNWNIIFPQRIQKLILNVNILHYVYPPLETFCFY